MGYASVTTTQKCDGRGEDKLRRARDKFNFAK